MARFRISRPARADLAAIFATSLERWGDAARSRYTALSVSAIRAVAANPEVPTTRDRSELSTDLRSFHVRNVRDLHGVKAPVHVLYYRRRGSIIEIVRVLHERMEPTTRLGPIKRKRRRAKR